jgi:hypothetical protein
MPQSPSPRECSRGEDQRLVAEQDERTRVDDASAAIVDVRWWMSDGGCLMVDV